MADPLYWLERNERRIDAKQAEALSDGLRAMAEEREVLRQKLKSRQFLLDELSSQADLETQKAQLIAKLHEKEPDELRRLVQFVHQETGHLKENPGAIAFREEFSRAYDPDTPNAPPPVDERWAESSKLAYALRNHVHWADLMPQLTSLTRSVENLAKATRREDRVADDAPLAGFAPLVGCLRGVAADSIDVMISRLKEDFAKRIETDFATFARTSASMPARHQDTDRDVRPISMSVIMQGSVEARVSLLERHLIEAAANSGDVPVTGSFTDKLRVALNDNVGADVVILEVLASESDPELRGVMTEWAGKWAEIARTERFDRPFTHLIYFNKNRDALPKPKGFLTRFFGGGKDPFEDAWEAVEPCDNWIHGMSPRGTILPADLTEWVGRPEIREAASGRHEEIWKDFLAHLTAFFQDHNDLRMQAFRSALERFPDHPTSYEET